MEKTIKLTENDISNIVSNVLNEVTWRTTNKVYVNYKDEVESLEKIGYEIGKILDKVYNESNNYNYGSEYINIHYLRQPIKSKIEELIQYLSNFKYYIDTKIEQSKNFEQYSKDDFQKEYNMSMSDYEDKFYNKADKLFGKYIDNTIDRDEYNRQMKALKPEQDIVDRINGN